MKLDFFEIFEFVYLFACCLLLCWCGAQLYFATTEILVM